MVFLHWPESHRPHQTFCRLEQVWPIGTECLCRNYEDIALCVDAKKKGCCAVTRFYISRNLWCSTRADRNTDRQTDRASFNTLDGSVWQSKEEENQEQRTWPASNGSIWCLLCPLQPSDRFNSSCHALLAFYLLVQKARNMRSSPPKSNFLNFTIYVKMYHLSPSP